MSDEQNGPMEVWFTDDGLNSGWISSGKLDGAGIHRYIRADVAEQRIAELEAELKIVKAELRREWDIADADAANYITPGNWGGYT